MKVVNRVPSCGQCCLIGHPGLAGSSRKCALQDGHVEETGRTGEFIQLFSSFLLFIASFLSSSLDPSALHHFDLLRVGWGLNLQASKK